MENKIYIKMKIYILKYTLKKIIRFTLSILFEKAFCFHYTLAYHFIQYNNYSNFFYSYPYVKMYGDLLHYKEDVDRLVKVIY